MSSELLTMRPSPECWVIGMHHYASFCAVPGMKPRTSSMLGAVAGVSSGGGTHL